MGHEKSSAELTKVILSSKGKKDGGKEIWSCVTCKEPDYQDVLFFIMPAKREQREGGTVGQ